MNRRTIFGLSSMILATIASFASANSKSSVTLWYNNNGTPAQTTVFKSCIIGDIGCTGTSGPSQELQLYADRNLQQPLREE